MGTESINIRVTGKEILNRLSALESKSRRLEYVQYFQTAILLILLGKLFMI